MKAKVIAVDETEYLRDDIKKLVGKWITFYVYHTGIQTHLCSLTGSYYLIPVGNISENEVDDDLFYELTLSNDGYYSDFETANGKDYDLDEDDLDKVDLPELVEFLRCNQSDYELECLQMIDFDLDN